MGTEPTATAAWTSEPIRLSDDDMSLMHTLAWMISDIHADEQAMASSPYGARLAAGPLVAAMAAARSESHARDVLAGRGVALGNQLVFDIAYRAPVLAGDVFTVTSTVSAPDVASGEVEVHDDVHVSDRLALTMVRRYATAAAGPR